jgi:hypothetical protein
MAERFPQLKAAMLEERDRMYQELEALEEAIARLFENQPKSNMEGKKLAEARAVPAKPKSHKRNRSGNQVKSRRPEILDVVENSDDNFLSADELADEMARTYGARGREKQRWISAVRALFRRGYLKYDASGVIMTTGKEAHHNRGVHPARIAA